jgi:ferrous iron transport protein B
MSCGARLPVYILFIAAFFPTHSGSVLFFIYSLGLILAVLVGFVLSKTLLKGGSPFFLMELPPYRIPVMKHLLMDTWDKGQHFLQKAGTFIMGVSILIWFLFNTPWGVKNPKDSLLGMCGGAIAPILEPLGFGTWEAGASLITGVVAKEVVVGTMGEIYIVKEKKHGKVIPKLSQEIKEIVFGFGNAAKTAFFNVVASFKFTSMSADPPQTGLVNQVRKAFTPLQSLSFMVFVLLYMPCAVTGMAMKQEFGTWKWYGIAILYGLGVAWTMSFIIYQGGILLGFGG